MINQIRALNLGNTQWGTLHMITEPLPPVKIDNSLNEVKAGEVHGNDTKAWSELIGIKLLQVLIEPWVHLLSYSFWSQKHSPEGTQASAASVGQNLIVASTSFSGFVQLVDYSVVFI